VAADLFQEAVADGGQPVVALGVQGDGGEDLLLALALEDPAAATTASSSAPRPCRSAAANHRSGVRPGGPSNRDSAS